MFLEEKYYTRGKVDSLSYFAPGTYQSNSATASFWRDFSSRSRNRVGGTMIEMHTNSTMDCLARLMDTVRFGVYAHSKYTSSGTRAKASKAVYHKRLNPLFDRQKYTLSGTQARKSRKTLWI